MSSSSIDHQLDTATVVDVPMLTSVAVVVRGRIGVEALTHVCRSIDAFVDNFILFHLHHAARFLSLHLLNRINARQSAELRNTSPALARCTRQFEFALAMRQMAKNGFLEGGRWLRKVYFPEGKANNLIPDAVCGGNAAFVTWVYDTFSEEEDNLEFYVLARAMRNGLVDVLQVIWNRQKHLHFSAGQISKALGNAPLPVLEFFMANYPAFDSKVAMFSAVGYGNLDRLLWLHKNCSQPFTKEMFRSAVAAGWVHVAQHLHQQHPELASFSSEVMSVAVMNGDLEMLKWLHSYRTEPYIPPILDEIERDDLSFWPMNNSSDGYWEVCRWLDRHQYDCPPGNFQLAVMSGNIPMLEWFHQKYPELIASNQERPVDMEINDDNLHVAQKLFEMGYRFNDEALERAAAHGYVSTVRWLHEQQPELSTLLAMDGAAEQGYVDIVRYFHEHGTEGCTTSAMDCAAANGHLDVVRFLCENRTEGCTVYAMDTTPYVDVLKYLDQHRTEGCSENACINAARSGNLKVLQWLYENKQAMVDLERIRESGESKHQHHILLWVEAIRASDIRR